MGGRLVAALALACVATSAHAATAPVGSGDHLSVHVAGKITARCTVQQDTAKASFGSIMNARTGMATSETIDLPLTLDCNAPYHAALFSRNGALKFEGASASGFADTVSYRARLGMEGGVGGVSLDCASQDMLDASQSLKATRCAVASADVSGVTGQAHVRLTLDAGSRPLLRGVYSDNLTLLVSPNVGGEQG